MSMSVRPHRIVTNGRKFKVQRLVACGALWWRRTEWRDLIDTESLPRHGGIHPYLVYRPKLHDTIKAARAVMAEAEADERARVHGWRPVLNSEAP